MVRNTDTYQKRNWTFLLRSFPLSTQATLWASSLPRKDSIQVMLALPFGKMGNFIWCMPQVFIRKWSSTPKLSSIIHKDKSPSLASASIDLQRNNQSSGPVFSSSKSFSLTHSLLFERIEWGFSFVLMIREWGFWNASCHSLNFFYSLFQLHYFALRIILKVRFKFFEPSSVLFWTFKNKILNVQKF